VCREREERRYAALQKHGPMSERGWHMYEDAQGDVETEITGARALQKLANLVAGLPKNPDHTVNVDLAVQVVNSNFSDLATLAAGDALNDYAWKATRNKTGQTDFAAGMEEARRAHPDLIDLYDNRGRVSAEVLRKLLWPIFKITNEYAQRKTEVRKYFVDESGREFRKY
jgi:hypothetical protein